MPNFWQQIKAAFTTAEQSSPGHPAVHELLVRSQEEAIDYDRWKLTTASKRILSWIGQEYAYFLVQEQRDQTIAFLNTPSSKGFVVYFNQLEYRPEDIRHFFFFLKEQVQSFDYRSDLSDLRTYSRKNWVETIERHYLKPRHKFELGKLIIQRFGNITISLELRDDEIHHLRLRATTYRDALYEEAEEFGAFMAALTRS